jgi:type IV fimbrial biogenesis protein FimT
MRDQIKMKEQQGFTLGEMLASIGILGMLFSLGVPSLVDFQRNSAMTSATNSMISGLNLARTEALKRQLPVTLCGSPDPNAVAPFCGPAGDGGYIVFLDDNGNTNFGEPTDGNAALDAGEVLLHQAEATGETISLFSDGGAYIAYGADGYLVPVANGQGQPSSTVLLYCDDRGNLDIGGRSAARVVNIAVTGRAQALRDQDDVATAIAATGGFCPG